MLDYQERVVIEKAELDAKLKKLDAFRCTEEHDALSILERARLGEQSVAMRRYSQVLGERIASFPDSPNSLELKIDGKFMVYCGHSSLMLEELIDEYFKKHFPDARTRCTEEATAAARALAYQLVLAEIHLWRYRYIDDLDVAKVLDPVSYPYTEVVTTKEQFRDILCEALKPFTVQAGMADPEVVIFLGAEVAAAIPGLEDAATGYMMYGFPVVLTEGNAVKLVSRRSRYVSVVRLVDAITPRAIEEAEMEEIHA